MGRKPKHIISFIKLVRNWFGGSVLIKLFLVSCFGFIVALQNLEGQVAGDYQTDGNVTFNSALNWDIYNGTTWVDAVIPPDYSIHGVITILDYHTATVTALTNIDQTIVQSEAILVINAGQTLQIRPGTIADTDLMIYGRCNNSGDISKLGAGKVVFGANSIYDHTQDGGIIRNFIWDPASTCTVSGFVNSPLTGLSQTFGHFTWNCPGQTASFSQFGNLGGGEIAGDLNIVSTGAGNYSVTLSSFSDPGVTLNIGGDLNISGGILTLTNSAWETTVNLAGDLNLTGGTLRVTGASSNNSSNINLSGDFNLSSGTINDLAPLDHGYINFVNVSDIQNIRRSGGTISNDVYFQVNSDVTVDFGETDYLDGNGDFSLYNGATLRTAHPSGLDGSIQCTPDLSPSANYTFYGTTPQETGLNIPNSVNNLTIDNPSGVTLTDDLTVGGILALTSGAFSLADKNLVIATTGSNPCSGTGTINGDAGSSFTLNSSGVATLPPGIYQDATINVVTPMSLVPLCGNVTVNGTLNLSTGVLGLSSYNLTIGSSGQITGYSSAKFVVANSTGVLKQYV